MVFMRVRLDRRLVDKVRLDVSTWAHEFCDDPIHKTIIQQ